MSSVYDRCELEAISLVRLKTRRTRLKQARLQLKQGAVVMTASLRDHLDRFDAEIKQISEIIYRRTGRRE